MSSLEQIKSTLLEERSSLNRQLALYKKEDPLLSPVEKRSFTLDEIGEISTQHDQLLASRVQVEQRLEEVENTLSRIESGKYGICENCGKKIEEERLRALPTAKYCLDCEARV